MSEILLIMLHEKVIKGLSWWSVFVFLYYVFRPMALNYLISSQMISDYMLPADGH